VRRQSVELGGDQRLGGRRRIDLSRAGGDEDAQGEVAELGGGLGAVGGSAMAKDTCLSDNAKSAVNEVSWEATSL
jgi:hypothetical protein